MLRERTQGVQEVAMSTRSYGSTKYSTSTQLSRLISHFRNILQSEHDFFQYLPSLLPLARPSLSSGRFSLPLCVALPPPSHDCSGFSLSQLERQSRTNFVSRGSVLCRPYCVESGAPSACTSGSCTVHFFVILIVH